MNPLNHVAIIMDGNGRWGLKNKNSRNEGHRAGLITIENILSSKKQMVTSSYNSEEKIYKSIDPQRRFNLKISYAF